MSNRDSLGFGDLLPQDVINIFAQEKHSKRGRKKRTRSLGRAFGLFRRKKKKNLGSKGDSHGLGPALDLALDGHRAVHPGLKSGKLGHQLGNSHAVPKRDDDKIPAPPLVQKNVFIESGRSKYVEDLHTEAQEGLKMMQQEENYNGMEYQDNESTVSTVTVQTEGEGTGFVTDSSIADTSSVVSGRSSLSTRSSRSGLTRQGSTFRPLNSGKKSEKSKMRKRQRRAVGGIPRHVQKELGLDKEGLILPLTCNKQSLYNGESDISPTTDGSQHEAESPYEPSLQASNIHPLSRDRIKQLNAAHASHRDDLALLHRLGPLLGDEQRPRSLAVSWMTTASSVQQQLPSPVMTMSPQAAYLSKIIPNAVLPPSIDVVEISRSRSRNSVRTVSKRSLLLSSPAPSRASSRASSSRTSSSNITSVSRYNGPNLSDNFCWSNSDSSDTMVSDSSTIASSSTQKMSEVGVASARETIVKSSNSKVIVKGDQKDGQFGRSLSIKKSKRAPPPPSRSYSLHAKMTRRSRDPVENVVIPGEQRTSALSEETAVNKPELSPVNSRSIDSPGYHGDISSLDDSTGSAVFTALKSQLHEPKTEVTKKDAETALKREQEVHKETMQNKVISPSSGYSSHNGTSPPFPKHPHSSSTKHKGFLAKLQILFSGSTSSLPAQPKLDENANSTGAFKPDTISVSPSVQTLRELFDIPPPPKVHAPPPPPPEVWAHNRRTFELLLGPPAPDNTYAIIKKNPKDRRQQRQSPSVSTESSVKSLVIERKHKKLTADSVNGSQGSINLLDTKKVQESGIENKERLSQNENLKENSKDEKVKVCEMLNGMLVKTLTNHEESLKMIRKEGPNTSIKATEINTNMDTLPNISLVHISPSLSSQLADHPVQLTTRKTTEGVFIPSIQVTSPESSWPLPPPPISQVSTGGSDEINTPLPPPLFCEGVQVLPDPRSTAVSVKPKVEQFNVTTMDGPQELCLSQEEPPSQSIPPPPPYTAPPPPTMTANDVFLRPKEISPPIVAFKYTTSSTPEKETLPSVPVEVSAVPSKKMESLPLENVIHPNSQAAFQLTGDAAPLQSIPPPPPLPSQPQPLMQKIDAPHKNISFEPETKDFSNSIFISPQNIPPPPPIEPLLKSTVITHDNVPPSPPFEFKNSTSLNETEESDPSLHTTIPLPPPLPVQVPASIKHQASPLRIENQNQEKTSTPDVHTEPVSVITPSILQMVKLRSVNNSPEPPETQEQVTGSGVPQEPTSIVTPALLQMVKLRSVNNSPEPSEAAKDVKEDAKSNHMPSPLQMVKLCSVNNSPEPPEAAKDVKEEALSSVTPSPLQMVIDNLEPSETAKSVSTGTTPVLQMVKLRSVNNSPEPPKAKEQEEPEAPVTQQQPNKQVPTSSNSDTPHKPIRKSLIVTSPTSTTPPAIIALEPALPKSHSVVVPPSPSQTSVSPVKKSPPGTSSVSMNLQEAIRLRTAARSKEGPGSRLTLQPPLSSQDFLKSPTITASFIFSKSNKVVPETKQKQEDKEITPKKLEDSMVTKVTSEAESKMGVKVPPPVAKKPKAKSKEAEASEAVEQTAGQEAQKDGTKDGSEEVSGTAGTVQEEMSSA